MEKLLDVLDRTPPYLCRFMATKCRGHKFMTHSDIARKAGIARSTVEKISVLRSWANVHVDTASRFAEACGIELLKPKRIRKKLVRSKRTYITQSRGRQKQFIIRLMTQANGTETAGS